jgi:glycosyltransferase involved in cell wall biosynthesis
MAWVRELAARVERLHVLCLEPRINDDVLPANVQVWSMGKERGVGKVRELLAFYATLLRLLPSVNAIFAHMIPRYAWLCAPLALPFGVPIYLWYTHRQITWELRLATKFCKAVFSAALESFPFYTSKLQAVGHGIDIGFFTADDQIVKDEPPLIIQVARLMPIKHHETLLRAIATGIEAQVAIVGSVPAGQDKGYLTRLQQLTTELNIGDRVRFTGSYTPEQVRDLYRRSTIAVNLSPPGLFDKAALESMITGVPTIVSNPAFDVLLGDHAALLQLRDPDDVDGLARSLRQLLQLDSAARERIAFDVQGRARTAHSLAGLMDRLVELMSTR